MYRRILFSPIKWSLRFWYHIIASYYRIKNRHKLKILVYTDSRGHEITKLRNRYNPFASYIGHFIRKYYVDYYLCPERMTTIPDFLEVYRNLILDYDFIVLHVGVVDFAPRPKSSLEAIYHIKKAKFDTVIPANRWWDHFESEGDGLFNGGQTLSLYSKDIATQFILPKLQQIPNLIWIGSNRFAPGWDGNYPRKRPDNVRLLEKYVEEFAIQLPSSIDLLHWDDKEIKKFTCDNVHLTPEGFDFLRDQIMARVVSG